MSARSPGKGTGTAHQPTGVGRGAIPPGGADGHPSVRVRQLDTFLPPAPTLRECLAAAPPWYVDLLRVRHGALGSLPDVCASLLEPERLASTLAVLDPVEKTAFYLVGTLNAGRGIPVEQCWGILGEITGQRHRRFQSTLDSLRRRGLLFVGHYDYRSVYFIPRDVRAAAEGMFFRPVVAGAAEPESAYRSAAHAATALRDLHLFLLAVTRGEIKLTRDGEIYRRQQIRLARLLGWPGWGSADPQPRQDCLAARMSVLWEYALARNLIQDHPDGVRATPALRKWASLSWTERWLDLLELHIQRGAGWHQSLFTLLQMLLWVPPGRWLPLEATSARGTGSLPAAAPAPGTRSLPAATPPPVPRSLPAATLAPPATSLPAALTEPVTQRTRTLEFLGILEAAEGPGSTVRAARLTPLGRTYLDALFAGTEACFAGLLPEDECSFIVAPNFEVVAPFTLHPRTLLDLGALADPVKADQALVFQISRASVYRALKGGMDGTTVLAVLEKGSQQPVPQNVQASIQEWATAYGRVWLARFHLLRCADAETAARLRVLPRLQPYVAGQLTPQDLILREGDHSAIYEILEHEGFLPRAQVELAPPLDGGTPSAPGKPDPAAAAEPSTRWRVTRRPSEGWRSSHGSSGRQHHDAITPGRAPSRPPIRVVPSDWFDLPGRR